MDFDKKVETCKKFRDETLIPERNVLKKKIKELEDEIFDYERLKERSRNLSDNSTSTDPVRIPLNLGSGYTADFEVFDRDFVLVAVGFGFYCQMTWREAGKFCEARIDILGRRRLRFVEKISKIEDDLKIFNDLIAKL